ncbi:MAG: manganese catalase family protein [Ruminococcus sp.]|nr:manganese catalase family protein [Ruminococcus sp.]
MFFQRFKYVSHHYDKKLQYPVKIKKPDPRTAQIIMSQIGGADGELTASLRYLNQRYAMPTDEIKGLLTDIGTEELAHLEIVSAIVYQLTRDMKPEDLQKYGFDKYFVDHTAGIYPANASGIPFTASYFQVKGDAFADLTEDMAAEQKARATYDNILRLVDDPDVIDPIRYLRQREIVHFQRFGEAMRMVQDRLDARNFYTCNPSFDKKCGDSCPNRCSHK